MKFIFLLSLSLSTASFSSNYCIALRGNGELIPAHWGAISHTIETFGVPQAIAGGSSASISTFFLDQLMQSPAVLSVEDPQEKAVKLAFLYKSLQGYMQARLNQPEWQSFIQFVQGATHAEDSLLTKLDKLVSNFSSLKVYQILDVLSKIKDSKVFYGPAIEKFHLHLQSMSYFSWSDWERAHQLANQIHISISLIGKFDAKNDANLLIRDGVINFPATSELYARIASFYRMLGATEILKTRYKNYVQMCSKKSVGRTWKELSSRDSFCQRALELLVEMYFQDIRPNTKLVLDSRMGHGLDVIVTGGIVAGRSANILRRAKQEFEYNFSESAGDVRLNPKDIYFGYTGSLHRLQKVEDVFSQADLAISQIDKSQRFLSLGHQSWGQALSLSANEPGLSAFTELKQMDGLAIGGWSDLHPIPLLKASGCEKVVYVTRAGGDTIFGQGLSKRVFNFDNIPWDDLDPYEPNLSKNKILNNNGRPEDQTSLWSLMYNLANPKSSFAASIEMADAVVCTNWNDFDPFKQYSELIQDAYLAPIYNPSKMDSLGLKTIRYLQKQDNRILPEKGYYNYAGCIPLPSQE